LKKENIPVSNIYGYDREEFTHLSVAALIASGSADVGMGIYSAAKAYGLEFIPVCQEEYDFILPSNYSELESVKCFIEILKSEEFKKALNEMGGYLLENTGEVYTI
jgi:putative molybdopterin biosynthesis protein